MTHEIQTKVIVVGGGLAGLSAAHTVIERGLNVILLDKNNFLGGNSTKATSGINGAGTQTQADQGIPDTAKIFYDDSAKSARSLIVPELTHVLTYQSASAVEWVQEKFNVDLSLVSRLGGHSQPRTHRGKEMFPGMTITYALMERLEDLCKVNPDKYAVVKKADVKKLVRDASGVVGCEYELDGKMVTVYGPVIIATGGYAADFSQSSLLKQYRPELLNLPTTNAPHSTGDGVKMVRDISGNLIHMEKVQVHPTGLVDPKEPDAKVKFLAAEALRGVGGLLLDTHAQRFADELGHRDYVTGLMWKGQGPFRLVLNSKGAKEIIWHIKHYIGRGLMIHYKSGAELARAIGVADDVLSTTFDKYNLAARTGKCPFGKKFFQNAPFEMNDEYYVAVVCPVLHFTMGGIQINTKSEVLGAEGPIRGLYSCGEVAGGVHGENRLGGSSLLGCVVFGRVAGASASAFLAGQLSHQSAINKYSDSGPLKISVGGYDLTIARSGAQLGSKSAVIDKSQSPEEVIEKNPTAQKKELKVYSLSDVAKHNTDNDCWVIVNGQVLDVTKFLPDHPGGKKAILIYAGRDATEEFNMLHKPDVVEKYAAYTIIGTIAKHKL